MKRLRNAVIGILLGLVCVEVVLRSFPGQIGISTLARFEPELRAQIAGRLGMPAIETASMLTPDMRTDGGPTIFLPAPGSLVVTQVDPTDAEFGAVEVVRADDNGLCNDASQVERRVADVVMAGDSFTFCTAMSVTDTAAYRLEGLSGMRVYNLGVRSTGPYEYLEMMKRDAPALHPKFAIMNIFEGNDLRDVMRTRQFIDSGSDARKKETPTLPAWSYAVEFLRASAAPIVSTVKRGLRRDDFNFRYSATVGGVQLAMNRNNRDQDEAANAFAFENGEVSLDAFSEPLSNFVVWAKAADIVPIVTYLPSMYTAYSNAVTFEDARVGAAVRRFSAAQRNWLATHADVLGYRFIDLVPAFQAAAAAGVVTHFPNMVHPTPKGHDVVALELARQLNDQR